MSTKNSPAPRDLNREYQDSTQQRYAYTFDEVLRRYMMRAFDPFLPPRGARVLEMGCFEGDFTAHLVRRFARVAVLDGASDLLTKISARFGASVDTHLCTFEAFAPAQLFDAIFFVHALEHVEDRVGVLKRLGSWLAPGGRLFLVVPNAQAPSRQIAVRMGLISHNTAVTPPEWEHGHRVTYTFDTLERDVRAAGFAVNHRAGVLFKALANFQFDKAMAAGIVDDQYIEGCFALGAIYPDLCASLFLLCGRTHDDVAHSVA